VPYTYKEYNFVYRYFTITDPLNSPDFLKLYFNYGTITRLKYFFFIIMQIAEILYEAQKYETIS
jgi:hypothetical protein